MKLMTRIPFYLSILTIVLLSCVSIVHPKCAYFQYRLHLIKVTPPAKSVCSKGTKGLFSRKKCVMHSLGESVFGLCCKFQQHTKSDILTSNELLSINLHLALVDWIKLTLHEFCCLNILLLFFLLVSMKSKKLIKGNFVRLFFQYLQIFASKKSKVMSIATKCATTLFHVKNAIKRLPSLWS